MDNRGHFPATYFLYWVPISFSACEGFDGKLRPGIPHPLLNRRGAQFLIVGAFGSGKTNWAVSQLIKGGAYHRVFDALHVVRPLNSRASFAKDPFEKHSKNYCELTPDVLNIILVDVKKKWRRLEETRVSF